jgi:hypothetical protein
MARMPSAPQFDDYLGTTLHLKIIIYSMNKTPIYSDEAQQQAETSWPTLEEVYGPLGGNMSLRLTR